jgi:hypothetical protein
VLYLSPTQEELATIYFALADPDRLRNYSGSGGVVPAGIPGQPALYLLRASQTAVRQTLRNTFPEGHLLPTPHTNFTAFALPADVARVRLGQQASTSFGGQIKLVGWSAAAEGAQLVVQLAWQAEQVPALDYTAFVHLLGADGRILTQLDRPPAGYPTGDLRPDEIVLDRFVLPLPANLPEDETLTLQTGFYDLATLHRLGEPAVLSQNFGQDLVLEEE